MKCYFYCNESKTGQIRKKKERKKLVGQSPEKLCPFCCITAVRTHGCCVRLGGSASKNTGVQYTVGNSRLTNVAPSPMYRAGGPSARRRRVSACGGARPGGRWCAGRLAVSSSICKFASLYIAIIQLKWLGREIPRNLEFILLKHSHI